MTEARSAGRRAGVLLLVQGIGGALVNFVLMRPVIAPPGFLINASAHAPRVAVAALLGLAAGALSTAIAITVLPVLRKHSEAMALWYLALAIAGLALAVVENGTVMSMLSLSNAYAATNGADPASFAGLRGVVAASRNWAHFTHLLVGGAALLVLFVSLLRFALIPRALAIFGIAGVALQIATISMTFFGMRILFPLLAPAGIALLSLALWLIAKGFTDATEPPARLSAYFT
ncbi:MAG TPA: DUF4386 domain-containing protein [Steroidobacteraceae bacterium]|nr:DUF4386 domain-containing protein [Steroidobacteraceae bacterium]